MSYSGSWACKLRRVVRLIAQPVYTALFRLLGRSLRLIGIQFLDMHTLLIGHLASEPAMWVMERLLGLRRRSLDILLAPANTVANAHFLSYWKKYFIVITSPPLCRLLRSLAVHSGTFNDTFEYFRHVDRETSTLRSSTFGPVIQAWADRHPLLYLTANDRERGWSCLSGLGVPRDAWFVCIHNREPGYYTQIRALRTASNYDIRLRDCQIENYRLAIKAITDQGGWCIRVGDSTTQPLPSMERTIDYAHLDIKNDWMDVFLLASCRFYLGCSSGLSMLSFVFGVPAARANVAPLASLCGLSAHDRFIAKLLWSSSEQRYLTSHEVLNSPLASYYLDQPFDKSQVELIENSPEDIRNLALEMLAITKDCVVYTAHDEELQKRFNSLIQPHHYGYGGLGRVGRDFLRTYEMLIGDQGAVATQEAPQP